jgi:hypothetical protein
MSVAGVFPEIPETVSRENVSQPILHELPAEFAQSLLREVAILHDLNTGRSLFGGDLLDVLEYILKGRRVSVVPPTPTHVRFSGLPVDLLWDTSPIS